VRDGSRWSPSQDCRRASSIRGATEWAQAFLVFASRKPLCGIVRAGFSRRRTVDDLVEFLAPGIRDQLDPPGRLMVMSWPVTPPVWNVRIVSCVPGSPIACSSAATAVLAASCERSVAWISSCRVRKGRVTMADNPFGAHFLTRVTDRRLGQGGVHHVLLTRLHRTKVLVDQRGTLRPLAVLRRPLGPSSRPLARTKSPTSF